jgi:hypothetical protein
MKKIVLGSLSLLNISLLSATPTLIDSYNPAVKNGADVWVGVDLLIWKPWERALVATNKNILQPGLSENGMDFIKMKDNYWGMGPRVGIAPRWIFRKGVSLNTSAAISGDHYSPWRKRHNFTRAYRSGN